MAIGGAFLGGGVEVVPAGYCKLEIQIMTEDRNGLNGTVTVTGGGNTYTATAGTDGRATIDVVSGVTYTVSTTVTGFNGGSQLVIAESATIKYVRFDVIKTSVGTDTRPVKFVNGAPVAVANDLAVDSAVVHIAGAETITGIKTLTQPMATTRAYSSANTSDIVTIGTLQASTDVVHISGNETITGLKTFSSNPLVFRSTPSLDIRTTKHTLGTIPSDNSNSYVNFKDNDDKVNSRLQMRYDTNGVLRSGLQIFNASGVAVGEMFLWKATDDTSFVTASYRTSNLGLTDVLTAGNGVTLGTEQTITAKKTFTTSLVSNITNGSVNFTTYGSVKRNATISGWTRIAQFQFYDKNDGSPNEMGYIQHAMNLDNGVKFTYIDLGVYNSSGSNSILRLARDDNNNAYAICPSRTYNAGNTGDIVNIGMLQQSTDVVHTSGGQIIYGLKVWRGNDFPSSEPPNGATNTPMQLQMYGGVSGKTNYANVVWINRISQTIGFDGPMQSGGSDSDGLNGYRIGLRNRSDTYWAHFLHMWSNGDMSWTGFFQLTSAQELSSRVRNITISSGGPSGGNNGEVWIQY